jgi:hypothetical protein
VLVSILIRELWEDGEYAAEGLFHDTVEAPLHDIQYGLKSALTVTLENGVTLPWRDHEDHLISTIGKQFGFSPELLHFPRVKAADILAASFEARDCKNLKDLKGIPEIPEKVQHLKLKFWNPMEAKLAFLCEAERDGISNTCYLETVEHLYTKSGQR